MNNTYSHKEFYMSKVKILAAVVTAYISGSLYANNIKETTPEVTAYYLSDSKGEAYADLDALKAIINKIKSEKGTTFNKLVISFVQPSLMNYHSSSLACTGLFGYFCDRSDGKKVQEQLNNPQAKQDFKILKNDIAELSNLGVDTYLAVGGWNFSCDPVLYPKSLKAMGLSGACGPEGAAYDTLPNPGIPARFDDKASTQDAKLAYQNLVNLTNDLGAAGIDLDYEEFWHADLNSHIWTVPDSYAAKELAKKYPNNDIPYDALIEHFGSEPAYSEGGAIGTGSPGIMPDTVEKFGDIIKTIHHNIKQINPSLKISAALPAVGSTPIMMSKWGLDSNTTYDFGAPWYHGNLKGLMYELAQQDVDTANMIDSMAVMSYDLSKENGQYIGKDGLAGQVAFYMNEYHNWLKSDNPEPGTVDASGTIRPAKYHLKGKLSFGFEVGKPGYPQNDEDALYLTKDDMHKILKDMKDISSGMIMWDILKDLRYDQSVVGKWDKNWAGTTEVLQNTCSTFNLGIQTGLYNCQANVPADEKTVVWDQQTCLLRKLPKIVLN